MAIRPKFEFVIFSLVGVAIMCAGANGQMAASGSSCFNRLTRYEVELLLADVAKNNPKVIKRWNADPEEVAKQMESLRQLLAFASEAQRQGLADEPINRQELASLRAEVVALNWDKEINKNNPSAAPFGSIADVQIKRFWEQGGVASETEFQKFIDARIALLKQGDPELKDREITEAERLEARDRFAKTRIYELEYDQKAASTGTTQEFRDRVNLQVRLQQVQFLARIYSEKSADKLGVTEEEIAEYITRHPEFDITPRKKKAQSILDRAMAGENFAGLANKFSDDPGNKGANGRLLGGVYIEVPRGRMVPEFEKAALALEPGQIAPRLVETEYGYHIIKLERRGLAKDSSGQTVYDVRHILISTGYKDPANPNAREMPVRDYVRNKLEENKEKLLVERLVVENEVSVPNDFTIPEIAGSPTKKDPIVKKRPVKKRR